MARLGCFPHDSCFLGPDLSSRTHFPERSPSGPLYPVQMSRLSCTQPRPGIGWSAPGWEGGLAGTGAPFFLEGDSSVRYWRHINISACPQGNCPCTCPQSVIPVQRAPSGDSCRSQSLDSASPFLSGPPSLTSNRPHVGSLEADPRGGLCMFPGRVWGGGAGRRLSKDTDPTEGLPLDQ